MGRVNMRVFTQLMLLTGVTTVGVQLDMETKRHAHVDCPGH
jgi:hypothetical protein